MLLALDPATRTGWALTPKDKTRIECGSWKADDEAKTIGEKCADLARQIDGFLKRWPVSYALVEVPIMVPPRQTKRQVTTPLGMDVEETVSAGSVKAQAMLWAIHGMVMSQLGLRNIPVRTISPATWRKGLFGKAHGMQAEQVKKRCKAELERDGVRVPNLDAAEAGMMAIYLRQHLDRWLIEDRLS